MNQRRSRCVCEEREQVLDLAFRYPSLEVNEDVRRAEVAVVLRDLVLEDQVVAERVPRQLRSQAVVLMQIRAAVREDQVRRDLRLQLLEEVLDRPRRRTGRSRRGSSSDDDGLSAAPSRNASALARAPLGARSALR